VARRASAFSMKLLACDPKPITEPGIRSVSLDTLLAESDFVTLHASLTDAGRGMIGEQQLRRMKPSAFLINTARGALLDEYALANALISGRLAGAALDVFATEPLPGSSPLRSAPNLLISPHQAGFTFETGEKVSLAAARAVVDLMHGKSPACVVNPAVLSTGTLRVNLTNTVNT
jgi:phosphoglycerate dehydrogenase-like enzyme